MTDPEITQGTEEQTSTESLPENNQTETTQPVEGDNTQTPDNVPFHEDPKIQDYISRQVEKRFEGEREKFKPLEEFADKFKTKENEQVPEWFGGTPEQWGAYQADQARIIEEAETRAVNRIKSEKEQEEKRVKEATDWFNQNVAEIEATGEKVDRNLLLKIAADNDLVDSQSRWNYKAAYQIMKASKGSDESTLDERKQLAGATTTDNKAEPKNKNYVTSDDFRKPGMKPW
jgi:hypothetical protein